MGPVYSQGSLDMEEGGRKRRSRVMGSEDPAFASSKRWRKGVMSQGLQAAPLHFLESHASKDKLEKAKKQIFP